MRRIPYTDIEIYSDPRMITVRKVLSTLISVENLKSTITILNPDNNLIGLIQLSGIISCNLKECISGYTMIIDPRSFDKEYIDSYKLQEDEYIFFNQSNSSVYLNVVDTSNKYFYNISNYKLIDKIEEITSFEDFQNYINLKSADGSKFFRGYNNKFILPIFSKFPNIAKHDVASLYVYDLDYESNLVVWKVFKKKLNRDVYTIFRVLKLY